VTCAHIHPRLRLSTARGLLHPHLHVSAALAVLSPRLCARRQDLRALGGRTSARSAAGPPRARRHRLPRLPFALVGGARALRRRPRSAAAPALCGGARALRRRPRSAAAPALCSGARALQRRPRSADVHLSTTLHLMSSWMRLQHQLGRYVRDVYGGVILVLWEPYVATLSYRPTLMLCVQHHLKLYLLLSAYMSLL